MVLVLGCGLAIPLDCGSSCEEFLWHWHGVMESLVDLELSDHG